MRLRKILKIEHVYILLLIMLFFGNISYLSFATDSFATFTNGFGYAAHDMLMRNGRVFIALMYKMFDLTKLPNEMFYYISMFLSVIFLWISISIFANVLHRYIESNWLCILLSFASIANIYIIEYFMFIEKCGFTFAILFNVIGVYYMEKFFRNNDKKYYIYSVMAMMVAIFTYQGTVALFIILMMPFSYKYAANFVEYIKKILYIGSAYILSIMICLLSFKAFFEGNRLSEEIDLVNKLNYAYTGLLWSLKRTFYIFPTYYFFVLIMIGIVMNVISTFASEQKKGYFFHLIVMMIAIVVFPMASIIQSSGWFAPRVIYPMASIVAVLLINVFVNCLNGNSQRDSLKIKQKYLICTYAVLLLLLVAQYFSFNKIYIDKYKLNFADEIRCYNLQEEISEYEEKTGKTITKIAFYEDENRTYPPYPGLFCSDDLLVSSFYTDWSDVPAINYYLDRNYQKVEPLKKYEDYFKDKDWNCYSPEQLVFDEDTLHYCIY